MQRSSFKTRKSLAKIQKQNIPEGLNNIERQGKLSTLPSINFPSNTLNLRRDPLKKTKKLPSLDIHKIRTSKSSQHLSTIIKLSTNLITPLKTQIQIPYEVNQLENINLVRQYSIDQLNYILENDKPTQFLQSHLLPIQMRSKMIDWMIQVFGSYKCSNKTFFQAAALMDQYYKNSPNIQEVKDLHLVGVCCMFMTIKLQQVVPIRLKTVFDKIAHKKIPIDTIKNKQQNILNVVNFNILVPTLYDTVTLTLSLWNLQIKQPNKQHLQLLDFCVYIAKMVIIDYLTISKYSKSFLTYSIIQLGFRLFKQIHSQFSLQDNIKKIKNILNLNDNCEQECQSQILSLVKGFQKKYPNLMNLKKFSKIQMDHKKNSL